MCFVPFQAAALAGEIGLEALVAPILSRRGGRIAPSKAIAALLGHDEISSATPPREFIKISLTVN